MECSNGSAVTQLNSQLARRQQDTVSTQQHSGQMQRNDQQVLSFQQQLAQFMNEPGSSSGFIHQLPTSSHFIDQMQPHMAEHWVGEFPGHVDHSHQHIPAHFENSFHQAHNANVNPGMQQHRVQGSEWATQFMSSGPQHIHKPAHAPQFDYAFMRARESSNWIPQSSQPRPADQASWSKEFEKVSQQQQQQMPIDNQTPLSKTAGMLLETVENSTNPKFKDSKFLGLMKQFRDGEAAIEGNKVVEQIAPATTQSPWVEEFGSTEFTPQEQVAPATWAEEFQTSTHAGNDWAHQFGNAEHKPAGDWESEFTQKMTLTPTNRM
jgi:hypothetical protein